MLDQIAEKDQNGIIEFHAKQLHETSNQTQSFVSRIRLKHMLK